MAERPTGKITDEGVARLRERIGVPEPWPLPPHYQRPNVDSFLHVAEAMAELGRDDLVLEWTSRGIAETDGWQISRLYDAACEANARLEQPLEILRLRRNHHERMPSSSTYAALREAAEHVDAWGVERPAARAALEKRDIRGFVDALLRSLSDIAFSRYHVT